MKLVINFNLLENSVYNYDKKYKLYYTAYIILIKGGFVDEENSSKIYK